MRGRRRAPASPALRQKGRVPMADEREVERVREQLAALMARQHARSNGRPAVQTARYVASVDDDAETGAHAYSITCISRQDPGDRQTMRVNKHVAKLFGTHERTYESLDDFRAAVDALGDDACWNRLLAALSSRDRPRKEVSQRLVREGFTSDQATRAVQKAVRTQLIDDERYAAAFIRGKLRKGWGRARIERELAAVGIEVSRVSGYPQDFFPEEGELARAQEILSRKSVPAVNAEQKLTRFLIGRGFGFDVARRAARQRTFETETSEGRETL